MVSRQIKQTIANAQEQAMGKSRSGHSTKIHLAVDSGRLNESLTYQVDK